jgi:cardiolipin synthase
MITFWLVIIYIASLLSAGHALLRKRDPRAALGWIVTCLAIPGVGAGMYWLFGVNRIRKKALELQSQGQAMHWLEEDQSTDIIDNEHFPTSTTSKALIQLSDKVTRRPLTCGNKVDIYHNGDQAYPAMLDAIASAQECVFLSSYIMVPDRIGRLFADALIAAAERGVDVRVMVDAVGSLYSVRKIHKLFKGSKVQTSFFMPLSIAHSLYFNLRNHRKILVVDHSTCFTGGMNIRERHMVNDNQRPNRVIDIHFSFQGPVCSHFRNAFMEDWHHSKNEQRIPKNWPTSPSFGYACCRGISAGPNEPHENLNWILIGALNCAKSHVRIMTPYFIPNRAQLAAINSAALRGVRVDILLPEKNNLPFVGWAANAYLFEVLEYNNNVYFQPPPFVHSKLMLIDDEYALVGSANFDPRSLRLNFEFNVEIFDNKSVNELIDHFDHCRENSRQVTLAEVDQRRLLVRLRDSFCKLLSPYL